MRLRPSRFCTLVMAWCRKGFRYKGEDGTMEMEQWMAQMDRPLPGSNIDDGDIEADGEAFMAALNGQAG